MKTINIDDARYPRLLKQIKNPPRILYYKGKWDTGLIERCLAVVGSRRITSYGRRITEQLVSQFAPAGITVVSGFMFGVDAQAHQAAVSAGGRTIAVMPCGIDLIHPAHQKQLYWRILDEGGLIISEWPGKFSPARWTYPQRNRIVVGLSQATLVVEAALASGSLISAHYARAFGRRLFAVPGSLTSPVSQGCLQLIREGAEMALCANDILAVYGLASHKYPDQHNSLFQLTKSEQHILDKLALEPCEIDVLSRSLKVSISELGVMLSLMQLKGLVSEERGKYYRC